MGNTRYVLEDFVPLSKSHLWKLGISFYDRKGPKSWTEGGVPNFITSNTYIAKAYSKMLRGFLDDCRSDQSEVHLDDSKPLYIIELGAGLGKFSFHFFTAIMDMLQNESSFPFKNIVYVMTDFTDSNFNAWQTHPSLQKFFASGQLDAAIFNAVEHKSITLHRSKVVLSTASVVNPVVIVANYLFAALCSDIFHIQRGVLKEGLVSTGSTLNESADPLNPAIIERLSNQYRYKATTASYYNHEEGEEANWRWMLTWYLDHFSASSAASDATVMIPVGAIRALRRLTALSSQRSLVLSGDKGNSGLESFKGLFDVDLSVDGSFSVMVNFHAISLWFASQGGYWVLDPHEHSYLLVNAFVLDPPLKKQNHQEKLPSCTSTACQRDRLERMNRQMEVLSNRSVSLFPNLLQAFEDYTVKFSPNDYLEVYKTLFAFHNPSLDTLTSALRFADWDTDLLNTYSLPLLKLSKDLNHRTQKVLKEGMQLAWKNYFCSETNIDVVAEIGRFYIKIGDFDSAAEKYEFFIKLQPDSYVGLNNLGICYMEMDRREEAMELFQKALQLAPDFEDPKYWLEILNEEAMDGYDDEWDDL
eukprot:CAMPEP_0170080272 /NCGR_PEP_ID=MMETSP0019_2-20121128/16458_1 /TAXON_ID=98059 /ORGANISM="Dinobryon sp., Strain UTEXLB2267" /LENGTH=585 /DNA_ID=CAMNT_0010294173 /DNA_START=177 /DNA_END=1934 /DNA_ORIENTATION=-